MLEEQLRTSISSGLRDLYFAAASAEKALSDFPDPACPDPTSPQITVHTVLGLPLGGDSAVVLSALISAFAFCSGVKTFLGFAFGFDFGFAAICFFFGFLVAGFFTAFLEVAFLALALVAVALLALGVVVWVALVAVAYNRRN